MKIFCNECYQPLVVHEYDIGIFVDRCECMTQVTELEIEDAYNDGHQDGYGDGYAEGYLVDAKGEDE